jgi:hypothetical protein
MARKRSAQGTVFVSGELLPEIAKFPTIQGDQSGLFAAFVRRPPTTLSPAARCLYIKAISRRRSLQQIANPLSR